MGAGNSPHPPPFLTKTTSLRNISSPVWGKILLSGRDIRNAPMSAQQELDARPLPGKSTRQQRQWKYLCEFGYECALREFWRRIVAGEHAKNRIRIAFNGHTPHLYVSENHPTLISPMGFHLITTYELDHDFTTLTEYEAAIVQRIAAGETAQQVGQALHRSPSTITAAMSRIREKLGSSDETMLRWEAREWYAEGVIDCSVY